MFRGILIALLLASCSFGVNPNDTKAETFAKKPFLRQLKPKHRFSAVFAPNHS